MRTHDAPRQDARQRPRDDEPPRTRDGLPGPIWTRSSRAHRVAPAAAAGCGAASRRAQPRRAASRGTTRAGSTTEPRGAARPAAAASGRNGSSAHQYPSRSSGSHRRRRGARRPPMSRDVGAREPVVIAERPRPGHRVAGSAPRRRRTAPGRAMPATANTGTPASSGADSRIDVEPPRRRRCVVLTVNTCGDTETVARGQRASSAVASGHEQRVGACAPSRAIRAAGPPAASGRRARRRASR